MVVLVDDICQRDRGIVTLFIIFELSTAFSTMDCVILLDSLAWMGVGDTVLWLLLLFHGLVPEGKGGGDFCPTLSHPFYLQFYRVHFYLPCYLTSTCKHWKWSYRVC